MIEISIKTLWWFGAAGIALVSWFVRLESKTLINKNKVDDAFKAVNLKLENHITLSKEKHDRIFNKLEEVGKDIGSIKISMVSIESHFKKDQERN